MKTPEGFTPGPWYVIEHPRSIGMREPNFSITTDPNFRLEEDGEDCTLAGIWSGLPEDRANAQLMAAAPQLLAALIMARDFLDHLHFVVIRDHNPLEEVRKIVAKTVKHARGIPEKLQPGEPDERD